MNNINDFIESGILEIYVMGITTEEETKQVEQMSAAHNEVLNEIEQIRNLFEQYATENGKTPSPSIKPMLMATIDYSERIKKGELPSYPPTLNENSKISDYSLWLNREDMAFPDDFNEFYAKIIGHTNEATTAIVWISNMAPDETHDNEHEKFLIVEGTCDIQIGEKLHQLKVGDYLSIPLHAEHNVKVTSANPCKIILQRIAA